MNLSIRRLSALGVKLVCRILTGWQGESKYKLRFEVLSWQFRSYPNVRKGNHSGYNTLETGLYP